LSNTTIESIKEKYGRRATTSPLDRELYSRDLAPVPEAIVNPFFKTVPELIVRPASSEEVADLIEKAASDSIPITPRASGSSVFFNAVPVSGGLVLDLGLLDDIGEPDIEAMSVRVGSAVTWSDLEDYLNKKGLACKSMPSSAPSASVGGWLSMMGYGIGSLKYGALASQVRSIEVVLPDGSQHQATATSDPPMDWFVASEGTLGIITHIELEIRRLSEMKHLLLHIGDDEYLPIIMDRLINSELLPFNMHFSEVRFIAEMKKLGHLQAETESGCLLSVDYEGSNNELNSVERIISDLCGTHSSIERLPDDLAVEEWGQRFRSIGLKRGGPSMLGAEVWLPLNNLSRYLKEIEQMGKTYKLTMMSYGHVVSKEHATAMTMFFSDETKMVRYVLDLSLVKKIQDTGHRCGGSPYGVGLWNTPYLSRIYPKARLEELRSRKKKLDPGNIMNPGKLYRSPLVLQPVLFGLAMNAASIMRRFI